MLRRGLTHYLCLCSHLWWSISEEMRYTDSMRASWLSRMFTLVMCGIITSDVILKGMLSHCVQTTVVSPRTCFTAHQARDQLSLTKINNLTMKLTFCC